MKIGVLGGTFDPIHKGHLMVAEEVGDRLGLAEVRFVLAGRPWLKEGNAVSAAEHRLEMVRLAIADRPDFTLSTIELERDGPSYTVDTLAEMWDQSGGKAELFFILGWDNLAQLPRWREPSRIIELCRLVAVPRVGYPVPDVGSLEEAVPGVSRAVVLLNHPRVDVAASVIRQRVEWGLPIEHLVPEAVAAYIREQGLYRKRTGGGV